MSLFKYTNSKYIEDSLVNGIFRIGTIHDYRNTSKYGNEVGEITEGLFSLEYDAWEGREIDLSSNTYEAALLRHCLNLKPGDPYLKNKIKFGKGSQIIANLQTTNGFIFCSSIKFDKKSMAAFSCDVCIEIFNPSKFIKSLSEAIKDKARYVRDGEVIYTEKQQNYRGLKGLHPAMVKPLKYKHQKEHRIIWEPITDEVIEPLIIECPEATKYCRKLEFE